MNIYLATMKRTEVIRLPVLPPEIRIKQSSKNEAFSTISLGDINLLGLPELASISIDCFFPAADAPYIHGIWRDPWEYVRALNQWRESRTVARCTVTSTDINLLCGIDSFEYGLQDGSGDVYYTLELSEFRMVRL